MLRNRNEFCEDKAFEQLTEAILERDQARTTDLFYGMIVRDGRSIGDALSVVAAAEAPFVNVPCHINIKDGNIALTNNDHTLLGLRASTYLMPYLPEKYRLLPLLQSVWHSCNVANHWLRNSKSPYKARILYLMANFINDAAHENNLVNSVIEDEIAAYDGNDRTPQALLNELDDAIMSLDYAKSTAVANAYLTSGADRRPYMETVALCASRFQDDPHNQKITISTFEEYGLNSTHLKDRMLLATPRLLAGWVKMPGERDCFARFEREWIYN